MNSDHIDNEHDLVSSDHIDEEHTVFDETFVVALGASSALILGVKAAAILVLTLMSDAHFEIAFLWGFVPIFDLRASHEVFRGVVLWSTVVTGVAAVISLGIGALARHRVSPGRSIGLAMAVPMTATLVLLEWSRTAGGDRLIGTPDMWRVLCVLAGSMFVYLAIAVGGRATKFDKQDVEVREALAQ